PATGSGSCPRARRPLPCRYAARQRAPLGRRLFCLDRRREGVVQGERGVGAGISGIWSGGFMAKVVSLHETDSLTLPRTGGAVLRVTPFRETPRVAITLVGPEGGDEGGVILSAKRARLLGTWLVRATELVDAPPTPTARRPPTRKAHRARSA